MSELNTPINYGIIHEEVISQPLSIEDDKNSIINTARTSVLKHFPLMDESEKETTVFDLVNKISGYGLLEKYLADDEINEIMINTNTSGYIEKRGVKYPIVLDASEEELIRIAQKIAFQVGSRFDKASPIVDGWLEDGSRFHAVMPPISVAGVCITIRKFLTKSISLETFCLSQQTKDFMLNAIQSRKSMVIAGGTSSGKTTLLNSLVDEVDIHDRIVAIEETAELCSRHNHLIRLIARLPNSEGAGEISLSELVKASLRMRPDRIVLGEVRSKESFDLIQALNTGHSGSMCTVHANGPEEVMYRLASLAMFAHKGLDFSSLLRQAYFGIDLIIYVSRTTSGHRFIQDIYKIKRDQADFIIEEVNLNNGGFQC